MNKGLLEILDTQDWDDIIVKLTAYVIQYCKWKQHRLPKGLEADDIALSAIEKLYCGERSWDPEIQPDLQNHLQSISNSIISNELRTGAASEVSTDEIPVRYYTMENQAEEELYSKHLDQ